MGGVGPSYATPISWVTGPETARLGTIARIAIPAGYRLADKESARAVLERTGNPVPDGLIGILAPESGAWWAVLEFDEVGYIKDLDKAPLDAAAVLQAMKKHNDQENKSRDQQGAPPIASVDWQQAPSYDDATHSLQWAVKADTRVAKMINNTMMLFGRKGVLEITAVQPYKAGAELPPLKELVKNITFKEEQGYSDYHPGDKVANLSLLSLIVDDRHSDASKAVAVASAPRIAPWMYYAIGGGSLVACGAVLFLATRSRKGHRTVSAQNGHATNGNGHANGSMEPVMQKVGSNGNGSNGRGRGRRKMAFDYARFYTDFVMTTHLAMSNGSESPNGNGRKNLMSNGHNGHNGHDLAPQAGQNPEATTMSLVDLIANQNALIEEQKRLIQEQTRLIEERNKFIKGQNEFLELQSAAFEGQYSLKLE